MSYNVSLLCGIKQYQLPAVSTAVENIVAGKAEDGKNIYKTVNVLQFPSYRDYNRTPVFYLRSKLVSNFFV
ncbi:MAG: hypothetical protein Ta2E_12110 [Mycoplasmoidaceae bacterium]|nr:MAG: hypothetical protein Ta2E_12110 [Mycoplasmoidaceae bacterium]